MKKTITFVLAVILTFSVFSFGNMLPNVSAENINVAETGGVKYSSLQSAIDAAEDGATVTVISDFTFDIADAVTTEESYKALFLVDGKNEADEYIGKTVSIDLNGHRIYCDVTENVGTLFGFVAQNNSHLTILDSSTEKNGTFEIKATNSIHSLVCNLDSDSTSNSLYEPKENRSSIIINGGNFITDKADSCIVYSQSDETVTINGGYYYVGNLNKADGPWIFNASGQNTRNILVNGGTFNENIEFTKYPFEIVIQPNMALEEKTENGLTTYTLVPCSIMVDVKEWSSAWYTNPVGYLDIEEAIAKTLEPKGVKSGITEPDESVYIVDDLHLQDNVTIPENTTLKLGYINTSENFNFGGNLYIEGDLTISEGAKISFAKADMNIYVLGKIINNGVIDAEDEAIGKANIYQVKAIDIDDNGNISETNGVYSGNEPTSNVNVIGFGLSFDKQNVSPIESLDVDIVAIGFKDGTPVSIYPSLLEAVNDTDIDTVMLVEDSTETTIAIDKNTVINFSGKTATIKELTVAEDVVATLKNGTVKANSSVNALIQNNGSLTLSDITLNGDGAKYALYNSGKSVIINGNTDITAKSNGYAVGANGTGNVEIDTDGIISGAFDAEDSKLITVIDGKYTNNVNKYCREGYHATKEDELYIIGEHILSDWKNDNDNHYKECTVAGCEIVINSTVEAHNDSDGDKKCDVCSYVIQEDIKEDNEDKEEPDIEDDLNEGKEESDIQEAPKEEKEESGSNEEIVKNPNTNNYTMITLLITVCISSLMILLIISASKNKHLNH